MFRSILPFFRQFVVVFRRFPSFSTKAFRTFVQDLRLYVRGNIYVYYVYDLPNFCFRLHFLGLEVYVLLPFYFVFVWEFVLRFFIRAYVYRVVP